MLRFTANLSLLFHEYRFSERFDIAKQHGFEAVEIQFPYTESADTLRSLLDKNQLKLVLFNVPADDLLHGGEGLAAVPKKKRLFKQALAQTVAYAEILQPEVINVLPGRVLNHSRREQYLDTFRENLSLALAAFSPLGIKTVFEAINTIDMPGFIIHNGRQMLEILQQINHPDLYMQYDLYHMQMMHEKSIEFIHHNSKKIAHIQFADCPGRGQPGTGNINFSQLFSMLENIDYSGWTGAEYIPQGTTDSSLDWFLHKN